MTDVLLARAQMGLSLAFHIVFAAIGIAIPVLMVAAEIVWRRTGNENYLKIARMWAKGTGVFFAVGAVSGTVLSFELGLLFPKFMEQAGPLIGMPFSLEGFAFFLEAIFLGIYLYGWERVSARAHLAAGIGVALSGLASAVFVTLVNAWMNAPVGFNVDAAGRFVDVDPIAAMQSPFALHEVLHMAVAAYLSTGIAAAAIHAYALLRGRNRQLHAAALRLCLWMTIPCALVQPLIGHFAGHQVAQYQPLKLAAAEGLEKTTDWAPVTIGPIKIPGALSFLAKNDPRAVVQGLEEFPREDWPSWVVRVSWQVMIIFGTVLMGFGAWGAWRRLRKRPWEDSRWFLRATVAIGPLGFIALEAGWLVTEMGRQPWIIYGLVRTNDTVTPMPGLIVPFLTFMLVYLGLAAVVLIILRKQVRSS